jgi:hypothetical protein
MQFPMATVKKNALYIYICGVLRYLVVSAFVVHRAVEREIFLLHRTNHYILEPFFNTPLNGDDDGKIVRRDLYSNQEPVPWESALFPTRPPSPRLLFLMRLII